MNTQQWDSATQPVEELFWGAREPVESRRFRTADTKKNASQDELTGVNNSCIEEVQKRKTYKSSWEMMHEIKTIVVW
ncbi:hypothetical protein [Gimesia panareensis]|uniref:Uncharacterized protein n=1 Tax=Gimesia panareensis TaxID=2527978 RepID=A0A518ACV3_9PLAN|nr:hypothetical protein [Gimesia panareensis]QDT29517.1 hypothetical protein Enr10x_48720 [Gimesia panareensis]QDU52562.1 hypothetical protein Pan110_49420 [Gimesia panareensis]